ncbi:hypothetical protein K491DRAFT_383710 [Lophiostoma macrostomum CBS 122681]|uniref:Uncharacterized protein n=1 Tax=Lophiostoma macrostomum CBS 122681 TaxID=1314788 RepID=A0A6A6TRZ2_9PLEO|nr:hypothetical protein K491DRAFT_383710 [Lophiostoma macrostomum CBS 122681]
MARYGTRSIANLKGTNQHLNAEEAIEAIAKAAADVAQAPTPPTHTAMKKVIKPATVRKVSKLHVAAQSSNDASAAPHKPSEPSKQSPPKPAAPAAPFPEPTAPKGSSEPSKTPSASPQPPTQMPSEQGGYHLNLSNPAEYDRFLHGIRTKYPMISKIASLEMHLNASKHDEATDDRLAVALRFFAPNCDGTNDHNLRYIKLVFQGAVVFQRFSYSLASPAASSDVTTSLHKLLKEKNGLSAAARKELAYKIHATEKSVCKALLALRGVPRIVVEARAPARVELGLAKLLRGVTSLPLSAPPQQAQDLFDKFEKGLSRPGDFWSRPYVEQDPKTVYPTKQYAAKPAPKGKQTKVLVDEKTALVGHFLGKSEKDIKIGAIAAAKTSDRKACGVKRERFEEDVPVAGGAGKRLKIAATGAKKGRETANAKEKQKQKQSQGSGEAMTDMTRILVQKQKEDEDYLGLLTGRGNVVQFGFKTK